jgi:threonine dehydratase
MAGVAATVVMPETAPAVKIHATRALGATVVLRAPDETVAYAKHLVHVEGLTLVPPYEDPWVIAGQGTVGLELLDQIDEIDVILVPVGGGGLISGVAAAVKSRRPGIKVIGVEPALAGDLAEGYATRERTRWPKPLVMRTIADGLRAATVGELPWAHIMALVDDVVTVSEESIVSAMALLAETARIVVEPSGAVTTAAVFEHPHRFGAGTTVAVATGGNIDLQDFASLVGSTP